MKKLYFLAICFMALSSFLKAQTYQNTTATDMADGVSRLSGCGFGTQPGVQMSEIAVPLTGTIVDASKITINLSLNAIWLGDVVVDLISPSGEAITLIRRIGGIFNNSCGDSSSFVQANILGFNSSNVNLIDAAAVGGGIAIPAGNYAPTYGAAPYPKHNPGDMSTFFNGKVLNGNWRLILYDSGSGEPSNINSWQIVIGAGATLKSNEAGVFGSGISLKQNPVEDQLMIKMENDFKSLVFEIYDISGKIVKKENVLRSNTDLKIDATNLSPGMYLLIPVKDGERQQAIKFIKK